MIVETKILDYHYLKKLAVVIYIGGLLCMFLLKTPLGITRNGATRWIKIPGLGQFQPAELVKIGTIAMTALLIVKAGQNIKEIQDCYSDMYNIRFCTGTACLCAVF